MVPGEGRHGLGVPTVPCGVRVPQAVGAGDVEQGLAPPVLRRVTFLPLVAPGGELPADVVRPQTGLVTAERSQPAGVGVDHQSSGLRDTQHLIGHPPRIVDVFSDVGGVGEVEDGVREGQVHPRPPHRRRQPDPRRRHLADIGFAGHVVVDSGRGEGPAEVAGSAADVEDPGAGQGGGGAGVRPDI